MQIDSLDHTLRMGDSLCRAVFRVHSWQRPSPSVLTACSAVTAFCAQQAGGGGDGDGMLIACVCVCTGQRTYGSLRKKD